MGLVREARREVCVSTLTAKEKREQARANQSEITSFMKHAALQSATWSGVHPHTKTILDSESSLGRLGIRRSAAESERHCITNSVTLWSTNLLDCGKITENAVASHVRGPSGPPGPPGPTGPGARRRAGPPISLFLLSLVIFFVELWPRFKAVVLPNCTFLVKMGLRPSRSEDFRNEQEQHFTKLMRTLMPILFLIL